MKPLAEDEHTECVACKDVHMRARVCVQAGVCARIRPFLRVYEYHNHDRRSPCTQNYNLSHNMRSAVTVTQPILNVV